MKCENPEQRREVPQLVEDPNSGTGDWEREDVGTERNPQLFGESPRTVKWRVSFCKEANRTRVNFLSLLA